METFKVHTKLSRFICKTEPLPRSCKYRASGSVRAGVGRERAGYLGCPQQLSSTLGWLVALHGAEQAAGAGSVASGGLVLVATSFSDCRWERAWLERLWRGVESRMWGSREGEGRSEASAPRPGPSASPRLWETELGPQRCQM